MGSVLPLHDPANSEKGRKAPATPESWASCSRSVKGDVAETGLGFAMLKLVCHDPEGQSLDPSCPW